MHTVQTFDGHDWQDAASFPTAKAAFAHATVLAAYGDETRVIHRPLTHLHGNALGGTRYTLCGQTVRDGVTLSQTGEATCTECMRLDADAADALDALRAMPMSVTPKASQFDILDGYRPKGRR